MRLVFVSHSLPPDNRPLSNIGGMQRVAAELLKALKTTDEIEVLPLLLRSSWRWIGIRIAPFLIQTFFRLRHLARGGHIDTVLFSSMVTGMLVIPLRQVFRNADIRTGIIVHGQDVTTPISIYQRIVSRVFGQVDLVFPVSQATAGACNQRGLAQEKTRVVHNGVDSSRFRRPGRRSDMRNELLMSLGLSREDLPDDDILLCSLGRQVRRKGFEWFVSDVMPCLDDHVQYWLGGTGPEHEAIRRAIHTGGLTQRVRLLGQVTEQQLMALYRGSDLFVMPNIPVTGDMEGFGIVMLEAGLNGLPTVASRLEGIQEVIREGENGYFVSSGDAEGFRAMIESLTSDRDRLNEMHIRARIYTEQSFRWDTIAGEYIRNLKRSPLA